MSFWKQLEKPIIALSPMDGVTDLAYREIQQKYGNPDVIFTEFIPVEGIVRMNHKLLRDFWYSDGERPVVAQIYGNDPKLFYYSTQLVCELGFDGVDINMGCPARSVTHRGCGAALIDAPELAKEIIASCKRAVDDWVESGVNWDNWPVISGRKAQEELERFIADSKKLGIYNDLHYPSAQRVKIPVTVKTRIGFRRPQVEDWMPHLLAADPEVISIHGRTLKQMYAGEADWSEIKKAVEIRDNSGKDILILGNGDVKSRQDAREKIAQSGVDGVLIGRGTFGNPWIFEEIKTGRDIRTQAGAFQVMLEHAKLHEHYKSPQEFVQMRKNLAWYVSGIPGAAKTRAALVRSESYADVEKVVSGLL